MVGIMERIMREVVKRLEKIIEESGKSKTNIAKACNHTPGWLNNILYQKVEIKASDLFKIAEYLERDISDFFPVPSKIDIEKISLVNLIRHIAHNECSKYCKYFRENIRERERIRNGR